MNNYIVRIDSNNEISSGFIHIPENSKIAYVICCLHGIANEETLARNEDIAIQFFDKAKTKYTVSSGDVIIKGQTIKEDIAVILIDRKVVPLEIESKSTPLLLHLTGKETQCQVKGLPNATDNELIRTIYNAEILSDQDSQSQIQLRASDAIVTDPDAADLLEGYSGSPMVIETENGSYCFGVFTDFEEGIQRIRGQRISQLNDLMTKAGQPPLIFHTIETDASILQDIARIRANTDRVLRRVRNKIGNIHLARTTVLDDIKASITSKPVTLISGVAGVGKSAVTKLALQDFQTDFEVIALQGEQLDRSSINLIFTEQSIGISHTISNLFKSPAMLSKKIILLDSLEKIMETSHADTIIDFFNLLAETPDLKIVLTCRTYASEYLQVRYLREFPPVTIFEVPQLDDDELNEILDQHPDLAGLALNTSVEEILRIPFNLDKATLLSREKIATIDTKLAFKNLVWKYVIENRDREPKHEIQLQRGEVLKELAVERSRKMTSFVTLTNDKVELLRMLEADNIIDKSVDSSRGYAIAHDIFEDWALIRFIDCTFHSLYPSHSLPEFFRGIGIGPSIRRSYRLWIDERLSNGDASAKQFLFAVIRSIDVDKFWKDETLLAILNTKHLKTFTSTHQAIFFENDNAVLKRCILLLNVACQKPNFGLLEELSKEDRRIAYSNAYLIPFGEAWATLLEFVAVNINSLSSEFKIILPVLNQWEKSLGNYGSPLPSEAKHVGAIILVYFAAYKNDLNNEVSTRDRDDFPKMVSLIYKLSQLYKKEISEILREAIDFVRSRDNYKTASYYSEFIDQSLSWLNGKGPSQYLPDLVIEAAQDQWLYFDPTPEELAALGDEMRFYRPGMEHEEKTFGITSEAKRDYFPSSAYQTPTLHLLTHHKAKAIQFIVEVFNHSVDVYWKSDFMLRSSEFWRADPRFEISYVLPGGKVINQHASEILWTMYRGGKIATPDLLRSVLQALEKHLLDLAKFVNEDKEARYPQVKTTLFTLVDYLLENSKTVSTTAVVIGVGTAYPAVMADRILPLLRVKQFYGWDFVRSSYEPFVLNPLGAKPAAYFIQRENARSNQLTHRRDNMRSIIMTLSFSSHRDQIVSILDAFYAENSQDQDWRFTLNGLDFRKLKVVDEVEKGFLVQTELDPDLQQIVDQQQPAQDELSAIQTSGYWALQKVNENLTCKQDEFELWQRHFSVIFNDNISHPQARLFRHPAMLAYLGLRDYFPRLSKDEMSKSIQRIFSLIDRDLDKSKQPLELDMDIPFTAFENDIAYPALVEIILKTSDKIQSKAKELCFWALIHLNDGKEKEKLIENVRNRLPEFASLCIAGICEYAKAFPIRMRLQHYAQFYHQLPPKGIKGFFLAIIRLTKHGWKGFAGELEMSQLESQYNRKINRIVAGFNNGDLHILLDTDLTEKTSPHYLVLSLSLIQPGTDNDDLIKYICWLKGYIFKNIDVDQGWGEEKIHYQLLQKCEKMFAHFLLEQPPTIAQPFFESILAECYDTNVSHKRRDFVEHVLEQMMDSCQETQMENFWIHWESLYAKILASKLTLFRSELMLDYQFWYSSRREWPPLKGKSAFFEKVIMTEISVVKETAKLLSGIGFTELLPHGLVWLWKQIKAHGIKESDELHYTEKLSIEIFYDTRLRMIVQNDRSLRECYIGILDALIDKNSPSAYLIREDVIAFNGMQ